YLDGDITIFNRGVDRHNALKGFDFGSAVHVRDEDSKTNFGKTDWIFQPAFTFWRLGTTCSSRVRQASDIKCIKQDLRDGDFAVASTAKKYRVRCDRSVLVQKPILQLP
ncbi:hypothetical protein A1O3_06053, partial [Capronia epimyces CBS 606.96]